MMSEIRRLIKTYPLTVIWYIIALYAAMIVDVLT